MKEKKSPSDYIMDVYQRKQTLSTLRQPSNNVNVVYIASKRIKQDTKVLIYLKSKTMMMLCRSLFPLCILLTVPNTNTNPTSNLRENIFRQKNGKTRLRGKKIDFHDYLTDMQTQLSAQKLSCNRNAALWFPNTLAKTKSLASRPET